MSNPEILNLSGVDKQFNMSVGYIPFSAHSDYNQTKKFIRELNVQDVILVHGDVKEMDRLKRKLDNEFKEDHIKIQMPKNRSSVIIEKDFSTTVNLCGSIAEKAIKTLEN